LLGIMSLRSLAVFAQTTRTLPNRLIELGHHAILTHGRLGLVPEGDPRL
jgi:hypothetical protein